MIRASVSKGQGDFKLCKVCHTFNDLDAKKCKMRSANLDDDD